MSISSGMSEVVVGVIDGPIDFKHSAFQESNIKTAKESQLGACQLADSLACKHGTFIVGILASKRESPAPAICPQCKFILRPIFNEDNSSNGSLPSSSLEELVAAIYETINAGAKIINLSLGLSGFSVNKFPELDRAYSFARQQGVIIVAASGNQEKIGVVPFVNHSWVIPVVACDDQGRPHSESNIGPSIGQLGVMAPGINITSTSPGDQYIQLSGASVSAPFVTGTIALLWSEFPRASASDIWHSIVATSKHQRRSIVPPLLNAVASWEKLRTLLSPFHKYKNVIAMSNEHNKEKLVQKSSKSVEPIKNQQSEEELAQSEDQDEKVIDSQDKNQIYSSTISLEPTTKFDTILNPGVLPANTNAGEDCPTCSGRSRIGFEPQSFVYVIGRIETPRFPNESVEKEFAQAAQESETANLTDTEVIYNILKENRYLAREACWPFTVEGIETYLLFPRDPLDVNKLIEAIKPAGNRSLDHHLVIGLKGPLAPVEMCNGLMVPIVYFDQIYSFDIPTLIKAIPKPKDIDTRIFSKASEEVLNIILQMADNVGAMSEHRALNYLSVRYPAIYHKTAEMYTRDFSLTGVKTRLSRLSVGRTIIDVIFTYQNRKSYFVEQYRSSVNVTGKYPFLERSLGLFLEI